MFNYLLLTKDDIQKRLYSLPKKIREILDSENNIETVRQICRAHHLNDEEKILIIEQLIGLILLGFVSVDDLSREISENIHLNKKHADDIVSEIDRKIFVSIRSELDKVYAPAYSETPTGRPAEISEEQTIDLRQIMKQREEVQLPKAEIKTEESKEGPVIIHKEAEVKPILGIKKSLGGLFDLVGKKEEAKAPKPVEAQVEIGVDRQPITDNKQPIRVVHYTELRTPLKADQQLTTNNQRQTTSSSQHTINNQQQAIKPAPPKAPESSKNVAAIASGSSEGEKDKKEEMIDLSTLKKV